MLVITRLPRPAATDGRIVVALCPVAGVPHPGTAAEARGASTTVVMGTGVVAKVPVFDSNDIMSCHTTTH